MKKILGIATLALGGALLLPAVANAAVTFDPATGTGFVGKGDVQLVFGWSNAQLQQNASGVGFRSEQNAVTVTEVSWECRNDKNETTQERERTTTTTKTTSSVVSAATRDNKTKQVTGFNLTGYGETKDTQSSSTGGPPANSCPSGPWILSQPAGAPVLISQTSSGTLFAVYGGNSQAISSF